MSAKVAVSKVVVALTMNLVGMVVPAQAAEFQEKAMCTSTNPDAAFPRISIQIFPGASKKALLILSASDGWTQVYSGPVKEDAKQLKFSEDQGTIEAEFSKDVFSAKISFNGDIYRCDERSFGH